MMIGQLFYSNKESIKLQIHDKLLCTCLKTKQLTIFIIYLKTIAILSIFHPTLPMDASYRTSTPKEFLSTPYKQVVSQYVTPQHKPPPDVNVHNNNKPFPQKFVIHQNNTTYQYKPKFIMSGYILGQPIAFTQTPNLPHNYARFSPSKENINKPIIIQTQNGIAHPSNLSASVFANQQNLIPKETIARPDSIPKARSRVLTTLPNGDPLSNTVRRQDYERLMNENILLRVQNSRLFEENKRLSSTHLTSNDKDRKIFQLQKEINTLKQQVSKATTIQGGNSSFMEYSSQSEKKFQGISQGKMHQIQEILNLCLAKYRQSILQQQKLLVDRFRLESKNQELDLKKQKLIESRKQQQHQTQRRSSHYEKTQYQESSPGKEYWEQPYRHSHSQRHWRK